MPADLDVFLERWKRAGAGERSNYGMYLSELADVLGIPRPQPMQAMSAKNDYTLDRDVVRKHLDGSKTTNFIDLYKRDCFILEAKQGTDAPDDLDGLALFGGVPVGPKKKGIGLRGSQKWTTEMQKARGQAESYGKDLPGDHAWPPFILVVDVAYCIEVYADFGRSGKNYSPFPETQRFRIFHDPAKGTPNLAQPEVRDLLRGIWTEPMALDASKKAAEVTREIADELSALAKVLEAPRLVDGQLVPGWASETVGQFLVRCLFTFFAEDIGLLPKKCFQTLLESFVGKVHLFPSRVTAFWNEMNEGRPFENKLDSMFLDHGMPQFNGGLFKDAQALTLNELELKLLIQAADKDWHNVEPSIFGTLLERALSDVDRHKLGAHYTPRAYVERLVLPTVIEPLRADWQVARAEALLYASQGNGDAALKRLLAFHQALCRVKVLDPACGSGNFLYVTLEHMKRLEGEVVQQISDFSGGKVKLAGATTERVSPTQLRGIELNPKAAKAADAVVWIGHLQWHFRNGGTLETLHRPILDKFSLIECRDAVLDFDGEPEVVLDQFGKPVTEWDGRSYVVSPLTGKDVPDESKRRVKYRWKNARKATWPQVEFIVGNPPFLGASPMRESLTLGYTDALRDVWQDVPESVDFVMYWWAHAATLLCAGKIRQFGFITTNSISQTFNRRVIEPRLHGDDALSLAFVIPDHPWVDSTDGAAVRIAMTVAQRGANKEGVLGLVTTESPAEWGEVAITLAVQTGLMHADLRIGANVAAAKALRANDKISCPGMKLHGDGFIVTPEQAASLGLGSVAGLEQHIRDYRNGRDLTQKARGVMVIDLFGLAEHQVQARFPEVYQWLLERVAPIRQGRRGLSSDSAAYAKLWWLFGKPRQELRRALAGLPRYIATVETAKHRTFQFLDASVLPDNMIVAIALADAYALGVLSSNVHVAWALAAGGTLEDRPRYNKSRCFDPFPFPEVSEERRTRIAALAESLDAHRKRQQALHPQVTLTDMYNVLEAERAGNELTAKEKIIHEHGLITVLRKLHDDLDLAVLDAYGWPHDLSKEDILQRLVDLNAVRADGERKGLIRWLRPEYQSRQQEEAVAVIQDLALIDHPEEVQETQRQPWPKKANEMLAVLRTCLLVAAGPQTVADVVATFEGAKAEAVGLLLEVLAASGGAIELDDGRWVAG